jgi:hypothetical protein
MVTAHVYLQIEGSLTASGSVQGAKVIAATQKPPTAPRAGTVLVRVDVRLPELAFQQLMPTAVVEIPDGWWTTTPVRVLAEEPPEPEDLGPEVLPLALLDPGAARGYGVVDDVEEAPGE